MVNFRRTKPWTLYPKPGVHVLFLKRTCTMRFPVYILPDLPQVMARHRSESPNCPFILKKSNNVPLIQSMNTGGGGNENLQVRSK